MFANFREYLRSEKARKHLFTAFNLLIFLLSSGIGLAWVILEPIDAWVVSAILVLEIFVCIFAKMVPQNTERPKMRFVFLEHTVVPTFAIVCLFIFCATCNINLNFFGLTVFVLPGISIISLSFLFMHRKNNHYDHYLKNIRVMVDDLELVFWFFFTVVFFFTVQDGKDTSSHGFNFINSDAGNIIKFFLFPYLLQTRVLKAYIGHLLLKMERTKKLSDLKPIMNYHD